MATPEEACVAVAAAAATGLPVWVSFTLRDGSGSGSGAAPLLRGGASLADAVARVAACAPRAPAAWLLNCSAPGAIAAALPTLAAAAPPGAHNRTRGATSIIDPHPPSRPFAPLLFSGALFGGYPNGFARPTSAWLAGEREEAACSSCGGGKDAGEEEEKEMTPSCFADALLPWARQRGARVLGGCCACGPAHIAALAAALGREGTADARR
jgi:S-methylmethionine-dependent homocysteine/selenocysteine methylase